MSGGRRRADDQHEILDFIHTSETDKQARKLARRQTRADAARERKVRRGDLATQTASLRRRVALSVLAVVTIGPAAAGVYLVATDFSFDPAVRAERSVCADFAEVSDPQEVRTAAAAKAAEEKLNELAGTEGVSLALSEAITSAAASYGYASRVYEHAASGPSAQSAARVVATRHGRVVTECEEAR